MHKKIAKNLTSFITAFVIIISTGSYSVFGEEYYPPLPENDLADITLAELSQEEAQAADSYIESLEGRFTVDTFNEQEAFGINILTASANDPLFEYDYRYDYFYKQLSNEEKVLYRGLYDAASEILNSDIDFDPSESSYNSAFCGKVPYSREISSDRVSEIYRAFRFSNPQFFFFGTCAFYGGYSSSQGSLLHSYIYLRVGEHFLKASDRKAMINAIRQKTSIWLNEINACPDPLAKELKIVDILCSNIEYDYDVLSDINVNAEYHQTIAGAIGLGKCVCNGYAMAVVYLCHLADIDSIGVVGKGHAWNRVNLFGDWYEVDVTWADQVTYVQKKWINKCTDTFLASGSQSNRVSHTPRADLYDTLTLPQCLKDNPSVPAGWVNTPRPAPEPYPVSALTVSDEEARTVINTVGSSLWKSCTVTNNSTATDTDKFVKDIIDDTGISCISAKTSITITPATETVKGEATIIVSFYAQGDSLFKFSEFRTTKEIAKLSNTSSSNIPGDVNGDGKISAVDIIYVRRYISHLTSDISLAADLNGDNKVTATDLILLRRMYAGA